MERTSIQTVRKSGSHAAPKLRTLALSDLHLGRVSSRARAPEVLAPLVEGFDRVLLLGDIIDHWYTHDPQAREMEQRLRAICKSAGVKELVYFRGNHDACLGGEEYKLIDGILYLHGHALYHRLHGEGCARTRIQALNHRKFGPRRAGSRKDRHIWTAIDRVYGSIPMVMLNPVAWPWPVVRRLQALAREVAPEGAVRAVVLGHTHRPGLRHRGALALFNLGGWLRNTRACAFIREGSSLKLVHIDNRTQTPRLSHVLHESPL